VPLRKFNPKVPRAVERVCLKALGKAPDQRWASAAEMAKALRKAAQSPTTWRRRMTAAAVLSLAVLGGITTYSVWSASRPAELDSSRPIAPVGPTPGSPEWQALGDELGKKAEKMYMPNLEKALQEVRRQDAESKRRIKELEKSSSSPTTAPGP
jgi:hypothetical protein